MKRRFWNTSRLENRVVMFNARDVAASIFFADSAVTEVFPEICSAPLGETTAGSIALIPNHDGLLLALITNESVQTHIRSIVILNLKQPNYPPVVFHENWDARDLCLYYKTPVRFEIGNKDSDIGTNQIWWRNSGVIASLQNEFFIRAGASTRGGFRYVNVKTGAVFAGELPNFFAVFGVWSIWLRDPLRERHAQLLEFDIHKLSGTGQ